MITRWRNIAHLKVVAASTYHRLVNTTPNPSATKNSKGELVGGPLPPFPELPESVAVPVAALVVVDDMF